MPDRPNKTAFGDPKVYVGLAVIETGAGGRYWN
jgi:hypothetical protein